MTPWPLHVLTLFPEWFSWLAGSRPIANAVAAGHCTITPHDLRAHSTLRHGQVDDEPYGGGAGMVLRVDVVTAAVEAVLGMPVEQARSEARIVALTPAGAPFDDAMATSWASERRPTLILCGRYEGLDHRIHEHVASEEVSIGPYVLSGGEIPAMAIIDACVRKLPDALGNPASLAEESFAAGREHPLEHPHYTRPASFRGWEVPEVLLGGHHARIDAWRAEQARLRSERRG